MNNVNQGVENQFQHIPESIVGRVARRLRHIAPRTGRVIFRMGSIDILSLRDKAAAGIQCNSAKSADRIPIAHRRIHS
ncbi:MAG: hypothetical protein U5R06_04220 [candidate division KSB1 bacterium]|nr:hypothetical protein [candidate division KSB1 bacterium]